MKPNTHRKCGGKMIRKTSGNITEHECNRCGKKSTTYKKSKRN